MTLYTLSFLTGNQLGAASARVDEKTTAAFASMPPRSTTKATRSAEPRGSPASTHISPLGAVAPTKGTTTLADAKSESASWA